MRKLRALTRSETPPPAPRREVSTEPAPRGFAGAVRALVGRKYRELRGRRWEAASERERRAEAEKRARADMAHRIAEETARSMSAGTVQRHARAGTVPAGVDLDRIERQAEIDAAGGIRQLAATRGVSEYRVRKWREAGGELPEEPPRAMLITGTVGGTLWSNGKQYPDRVVRVDLRLDAEDASPVRQAVRMGDTAALMEELDRHITDQVDWSGVGDRRFETMSFDGLDFRDD
ncbi:hypothetical protein [Mycolicibacterium insubricum]|nr:hypothetical protein [Mycolicibacterium insubricum]